MFPFNTYPDILYPNEMCDKLLLDTNLKPKVAFSETLQTNPGTARAGVVN